MSVKGYSVQAAVAKEIEWVVKQSGVCWFDLIEYLGKGI